MRWWWWVGFLWACDDTSSVQPDARLIPRDAQADARSQDGGPRDGGADAALPDARPGDAAGDAAASDAVAGDAASRDAARDDAGPGDTGPGDATAGDPDATPRDAAVADASQADDARADAAPIDAGVDPCAQPIDLNAEIAARGFYDGTTRGAPAATLGTCGGAAGGEVVFRYVAVPGEVVVFATDHPETLAPTVLYLRAACGDVADLACVRGNNQSPGARLVFEPPGPGPYFLVVDTGARDGGGPFRLTAGPPPAPACQDGRDNDGDGRLDLDDPGCGGPDDDSEGDPPTLPLCADGLDNDEDGVTDFPNDPDCLAAGDDGETGQCLPDGPCDGRNTGAGFQDGSTTGGPWISWRWRPQVAGEVTRLELFTGEAGGATALSLHATQNNQPGARLARGAFMQALANGWQGAELDAAVLVEAGVDYWIVWETVANAQSPFDLAGEAVDYRGSPDQGRSWNGPFQAPLKYRVFCCQD